VIRLATPDDRAAVLSLMQALVLSLIQYGSAIRPGLLTNQWLASCFDSGICVVAEVAGDVVGASLAIPGELPYDSADERLAIGVGTYVTQSHRKQGHALALYAGMARELAARGFDAYRGGYLLANDAVQPVLQRAGFRPVEVSVVMPLGRAEPC